MFLLVLHTGSPSTPLCSSPVSCSLSSYFVLLCSRVLLALCISVSIGCIDFSVGSVVVSVDSLYGLNLCWVLGCSRSWSVLTLFVAVLVSSSLY